jgi:hypothetical protein
MPIGSSVTLGTGDVIHHPDLVNMYGCTVHSFICEGVTVEDEVGAGAVVAVDVPDDAVAVPGGVRAQQARG